MHILVTGGAGYIGSHTVVELLARGDQVSILDNFYNSKPEVLNRLRTISGKDFDFFQVDLLDREAVFEIFRNHSFDAVIHFAGLKAVGESVSIPLRYYHNNITGTLNLCDAMAAAGVKKLVFSSSATVYGVPKTVPISEDFPLSTTNPYGSTKLMLEQIFRDLAASDPQWSIALLRYFNPIGAHESGLIGEDPNGIPNNLLPYIAKVAVGQLDTVHVFGNDYPTQDGTGVRDYIHVVDLAKGHLSAVDHVARTTGVDAFNLGTGKGYSVLQVIEAYQKASGKTIPYQIDPRRPGDVAECFANPQKALEVLGWSAKLGIEEMCESSWNWQSKNPNGFDQ